MFFALHLVFLHVGLYVKKLKPKIKADRRCILSYKKTILFYYVFKYVGHVLNKMYEFVVCVPLIVKTLISPNSMSYTIIYSLYIGQPVQIT